MNKKPLFSARRLKINKVLLNITVEDIYLYLRRLFYYYFKRKQMMKSIANREGYCNYKVCGDLCCNVFCSMFDTTSKECVISNKKPIFCSIYPFDEKDKSIRIKSLCTFYW